MWAAACGDADQETTGPVPIPNRPPQAVGAIPDQSVSVGETAAVDVSSYFSDPDGDVLSYAAASSNAGVAGASVSGSSLTVAALAPGVATVTVSASDPEGGAALQTVQVTVPNRAPEAVGAIPAQTVFAGQTAALDASMYFRDPDGDPLTYTATSSSPEVATATVAAETITIRAVTPGVATVTVSASDPEGGAARQTVQVTVPNRAPEAVGAIPAQTVFAGQTAALDASMYFRDPDGDPLTYTATSSSPEVATATVAAETITIRAVTPGVATVTVSASDPEGGAARQTVQVTVPNRAPEAVGAIPAQTVFAGQTSALDASMYFRDPDGDPLTYTATSSSPEVATAAVAAETITIRAVTPGVATVTVSASDPEGGAARQTVQVTVPNRAPEAVGAIPAQTVFAGQTSALDASMYFRDPDGDPLTYTATSSSPEVATATVAAETITIRAVTPGVATVTVSASDPEGGAATQQASVTVTPPAPDLTFTGVTPAYATLTPGGSVMFEFRILNQGTVASGATTIRAMRSPNPIVSIHDTELKSYSLSSLAASRDRTFQLTISTDANTAAGTIFIGMCIDAVTDESNTRNNCSQGARLTITASSHGRESAARGSAGGGPAIRVRASRPPAGVRPAAAGNDTEPT